MYAGWTSLVVPTSPAAAPFIGSAEIAFSLTLVAGFWRRLVYGLATIVNGILTFATW